MGYGRARIIPIFDQVVYLRGRWGHPSLRHNGGRVSIDNEGVVQARRASLGRDKCGGLPRGEQIRRH